jgi:hypothetical protein
MPRRWCRTRWWVQIAAVDFGWVGIGFEHQSVNPHQSTHRPTISSPRRFSRHHQPTNPTQVCELLLEAVLVDEPGVQDDLGYVVDGFPRTAVQVGCWVLYFVWGGGRVQGVEQKCLRVNVAALHFNVCCTRISRADFTHPTPPRHTHARAPPNPARWTLSSCCLTRCRTSTWRTTTARWP